MKVWPAREALRGSLLVCPLLWETEGRLLGGSPVVIPSVSMTITQAQGPQGAGLYEVAYGESAWH